MKILRNYQPEIFGAIVGLAALNVWYLSSVAIEDSVVPKSYDYLVRAFTVAVGAFIGAFSAFWLKSYEEGKKYKASQKRSLNSALFVLVRQINAIHCIKQDLEKYKTPFERGLSLPAMKPPDYSNLKQDIESLHFLIDNDSAQILMELTVEQERFEQAINSINLRNEFYVKEVQPALSFHALNGRPLPLAEFEEKLGERLFQGAINGAATLYEHVYTSEGSLHEKYTELRDLAKKIFPGEKFIAWTKM
ncbi:hypothetical protein [Pseudomonas sp.]|uniref:hypothetical protein n=1 Tax=Pseudomonas sp. TaxID=306 RepID=UPI00299ED12E|nr:hypothetical protein [Pseudomonas sp.]MDX1367477.1 hypothetical protein [Pseudomonas sp.]